MRYGRRKMATFPTILWLLLAVVSMTTRAEVPAERQVMLQLVRDSVRESASYTGIAELSDKVMAAMGAVPREAFVLPEYQHLAYRNAPLPIKAGQTISQPLIVALMTELLDPQPGDVILEVGTGSGYQAAILSEIVRHVYTVEVIPSLASSAGNRLREYGYDNITVHVADGAEGWPAHAPYDGIIVTAATPTVPQVLLQQLQVGGRLVIPLGHHTQTQELTVIEKLADGSCRSEQILAVRFVPLTHGSSTVS